MGWCSNFALLVFLCAVVVRANPPPFKGKLECPSPACKGRECQVGPSEDGPCPVCVCKKPCEELVCNPGCRPETPEPDNRCPQCVCDGVGVKGLSQPALSPLRPRCPEPFCVGKNCKTAPGVNGCPVCQCEPSCPDIVCLPGCDKEQNPLPGKCPSCVCTTKRESPVPSTPICATPLCVGTNCRTVIGTSGCPTCHCEPDCSEIECLPGCEKEKNPLPGKCPVCVCNAERETFVPTLACSTPLCVGTNCRTVIGTSGCPTCHCESDCPEIKCLPGCEKEQNPPPGKCPACVCTAKRESVPQAPLDKVCPYPNCIGTNCKTVPGSDGCPVCQCEPSSSCPEIVCGLNCKRVEATEPGKCATCECSATEEPRRCPAPDCRGVNCKVVPGTGDNCPTCQCEKADCPQLHCGKGCFADPNPRPGSCPSCVCRLRRQYRPCPSPNCIGVNCRTVPGRNGCPTCVCDSSSIQPDYSAGRRCPAPSCYGQNCRVVTGQNGCPTCTCDYSNSGTGQIVARPSDINCPVPACGAGCRVVNSPYRCPTCACY